MRHTFFGGITPAARKENTRRKPISFLSQPPTQVVIPLIMSVIEPSRPLVRAGDKVEVGQPIALGKDGYYTVHSSVSGRVSAIENRPHPWGGNAPAIVIHNDGEDTYWSGMADPLDPNQLTREAMLTRLRDSGIVGMSGSAYPTWTKLTQAAGNVDTLIINAAECEPYVTADYRLLLERSDQILVGGQSLARCLGAKQAILVIEGDKLNAVEAVERRLRSRTGKVQLRTVRARYPLGAEKQIIQTATGREVPPGRTPLDIRCVVLNVATLFAVQQSLFKGLPLTHRVVTVSGGGVERPRNLWVPIGTSFRHLLKECGGLREKDALLLTGGPMMGSPVDQLDAPIVKNTNSLICMTQWERSGQGKETVCIRCGKCISTCPMHLSPLFIQQALQQEDIPRLTKLHPEDCIACGCCTYSCPAHIPLVEQVAKASALLKKGGRV